MRYDVLADKTDEELLKSYYLRCVKAFFNEEAFKTKTWLFAANDALEPSKYQMAYQMHMLSLEIGFDSLQELEMHLALRGD